MQANRQVDKQTNKQAAKHTDTLIAIRRTPTKGEIKMTAQEKPNYIMAVDPLVFDRSVVDYCQSGEPGEEGLTHV